MPLSKYRQHDCLSPFKLTLELVIFERKALHLANITWSSMFPIRDLLQESTTNLQFDSKMTLRNSRSVIHWITRSKAHSSAWAGVGLPLKIQFLVLMKIPSSPKIQKPEPKAWISSNKAASKLHVRKPVGGGSQVVRWTWGWWGEELLWMLLSCNHSEYNLLVIEMDVAGGMSRSFQTFHSRFSKLIIKSWKFVTPQILVQNIAWKTLVNYFYSWNVC